jgi:hypothetical protein
MTDVELLKTLRDLWNHTQLPLGDHHKDDGCLSRAAWFLDGEPPAATTRPPRPRGFQPMRDGIDYDSSEQ